MRLLEMIKKYWKVTAGVVGLVLVIIVSGGNCSSKVGPQAHPTDKGITIPPNASVYTVQGSHKASRVPVIGSVKSEETVSISARIPATVNKVFAASGKKVRRGETLVILDDREIKDQLSAVEAQFKQAETEYQRTRKLMDAKATTDQAMVAAESGLNTVRAQMNRVKVMLSYTVIKSPLNGIVTERHIEVGDMASPGQPLLSIYDPTRMRLECPVPVRLVDKLSVGKEVEVVLDQPAKTYKGRVSEIVSEIDASTRTQKIKISLETVTTDVLPGSFGRLFIEDDASETILIPASAVYRVGQIEMVQIVDDNYAIRRMVKTGTSRKDQLEIISGLNTGEKILVNPVKGD